MSFYLKGLISAALMLILLTSCSFSSPEVDRRDLKSKGNDKTKNIKSEIIENDTEVLSCGQSHFSFDRTKKIGSFNNKEKSTYKYQKIYVDQSLIFFINKEGDQQKLIAVDLCKGEEILNENINGFLGMSKMENRYFVELSCTDCPFNEMWELEFELKRLEIIDLSNEELGGEELSVP